MAEPNKTPKPPAVPPLTPAQRQALDDAQEEKMRRNMKEAYDKATTYPESTGAGRAKGGKIRGGGVEKRGKTKGRFV